MALVTVDLKQYPKFWQEFAARGSAFDPSAIVTAEQFEQWMLEWYELHVTVKPGLTFGLVLMNAAEFTAFSLKWS